jgi:pimeloyl-ACP methyl ester carboxylesterase
MRKAAICIVLAFTVLFAACGTSSDSPSAVSANTVATGSGHSKTTAPTSSGTSGSTSGGTSGSTSGGSTAPGSSPSAQQFEIKWGKVSDGVQRGTIEVPIDYSDPSQGTFTLQLARHLAENPDERIGTLLVNPGGPGFPGLDFAEQASQVYDQDLRDHFDILAWDPRGTGTSTPAIDCFSDYDHFFDNSAATSDSAAAEQQNIDLAKEATNDCVTKNAKILQHVGTNDSARDMDAIRQALGEDKISYFGFSYGSELGATWATLFPDTVRAAVLDGASDPNESLDDSNISQSKGFEAALDTFLKQCSADSTCAFHNGGDAEGAYDKLMASIEATPLPALKGRPDLTLEAALSGVAEAMYSDADWPTLAKALAQAQGGDGSGLMELYDTYFQRQSDGTYDNSLEAFNVISCMDSADRPTVAQEDATAATLHQVAPRLNPTTTSDYFCTFYPQSADPRVKITGTGAGPIVVVGTTGDPATPITSSQAMAAALEHGVFVTVVADQHTGYNVNQCINDAVDNYLVDPTKLPATGLVCK